MSLRIWLPLDGTLENKGLYNASISSTDAVVDNSGKTGKCMKVVSSTSLGYIPDFNTKSISLCGWFKFNRQEIKDKVSTLSFTDSRTTPTGNLIGNNSHGGIGIIWNGNNYYSSNDFTSMSVFGYIRTATTSKSTSSFSVDFDTWIHIALVWNVSTRTISLYKNGVLLNSQAVAAFSDGISRALYLDYAAVYGGNGPGCSIPMRCNDVRVYDHALSKKEVHDIAQGLVLHYKLSSPYNEPTTNIGGTSVNYSNMNYETIYSASGCGGDAGTVVFHKSGGYNNGPYKEYHKTATGTGGIYRKTANDITIVSGKTYTMSIYVKASRDYTDSTYSFNINGVTANDSNHYITVSPAVHFTTEWQRISRTFTATDNDAGTYGEMSIIYNDTVTDYYVYFSCFQIEEKDHVTPFVIGSRNGKIYDSSGYGHHLICSGHILNSNNTAKYNNSLTFNGTEALRSSTQLSCIETLSAWVKTSKNKSTSQMMVDIKESRLCISFYNGCIITEPVNDGNRNTGSKVTLGSSYLENQWNHIVVVKTGTYTRDVYCNGVKLAATSHDHWISGDGGILIGTRSATAMNLQYYGELNDIRAYATALSEKDIIALYNESGCVAKPATLESMEFDEESKNLFNLADFKKDENTSVASHNDVKYVLRNGEWSIPLPANAFYFGSGDSRNLIFQDRFLPNTQYRFDFWIDYDSVVYDNVNRTAGIIVHYSNGTNSQALCDTGDQTNPRGWIHKTLTTTAGLSVTGLSIYYWTSTAAYYRWDSVIVPVDKTFTVKKNGTMSVGQLREQETEASAAKGYFDAKIFVEA